MMRIVLSAAFGSLLLVPTMAGAGGGMGGMQMQSHASAAQTSTTRGPSHTGQPNQSCGSPSAPETPGNAANAPGSAFNPGGKAGTVYAGQQPQNSGNTASVSQYDAACSHQH